MRTEMCAPSEHVLTWWISEGLPDCDIQMVYFDGEPIGKWKEAVAQLKEMALPPGTVVKVVREHELQTEERLLIDVRNGLVNDLVSSGVQLEYYVGGKKLEVHTLAWWGYDDDSMREAECPEDARYIFDNRYIGKGAQALAALKRVKIGKEAFVQVLPPYKDYRSSRVRIVQHPEDLIHEWRKAGIHVEFLVEYVSP